MQRESEVKKLEQQQSVLRQDLQNTEERAARFDEALKLLARAFRPMRLRIKELRDQKLFLSKRVCLRQMRISLLQYRRTERLQRDILDLMQAMTGEFQSPRMPKHKTSFRVAVIFVIAANRLRMLVRSRTFMGIPVRFGRETIHLTNPATMPKEQGTVYSFTELF